MAKRANVLMAMGLVTAACASPPSGHTPSPRLDINGPFKVTLEARSIQFFGTLTLSEVEGRYSGYLDTDMGGASVANFVVDGNTVSFSAPEAGLSFRVIFEGNGFSGTFAGTSSGSITGAKRE